MKTMMERKYFLSNRKQKRFETKPSSVRKFFTVINDFVIRQPENAIFIGLMLGILSVLVYTIFKGI